MTTESGILSGNSQTLTIETVLAVSKQNRTAGNCDGMLVETGVLHSFTTEGNNPGVIARSALN